jgi:hypothetical protein
MRKTFRPASDYPHIRRDTYCPFCGDHKRAGLLACWPCFQSNGMKYGDTRAENVLRDRERFLRDNGRDPGFVDLDRMYEDACADICGR